MATFEDILFGLIISFFAGMTTMVGGIFVFVVNPTSSNSKRILGASLGFSAGVMIAISFIELLPTAQNIDFFLGNLAFFIGFFIIMLIDFYVPHAYKAEDVLNNSNNIGKKYESQQDMKDEMERIGLKNALGVSIHNFPEGVASFSGFLVNPALGFVTAIAIAIHNIPEGFSVAIPLSYSSQQRRKAFLIATLAGVAEPIGAIITALLLLPFLDQLGDFVSLLMGFVGGIMIFISFDELLPAARKYGEPHMTTWWLFVGMLIMTATLILFNV
ncbi:MAG: zinc transporter ZupT [Candidatus Hodarchaeales archaeon]|jgi:ZIP family zinc transporter